MRMRLFRSVLILTITAALASVAGFTPAFARDVTVTISNFAFGPQAVTISAGDTVTFVNGDDTIHSVVADDGSFHSDGLDTNDKVTLNTATYTVDLASRN